MRKLTYIAVFEPSSDGGYGVYFPDLPGCVSYGKDFEEALKEATDALELHIYGMEPDGEELPIPSKNPKIDPETAEGYLVSPVTVFPDIVKNELDNCAKISFNKPNADTLAAIKEVEDIENGILPKLKQSIESFTNEVEVDDEEMVYYTDLSDEDKAGLANARQEYIDGKTMSLEDYMASLEVDEQNEE